MLSHKKKNHQLTGTSQRMKDRIFAEGSYSKSSSAAGRQDKKAKLRRITL
jgi:hypothetical protein